VSIIKNILLLAAEMKSLENWKTKEIVQRREVKIIKNRIFFRKDKIFECMEQLCILFYLCVSVSGMNARPMDSHHQ